MNLRIFIVDVGTNQVKSIIRINVGLRGENQSTRGKLTLTKGKCSRVRLHSSQAGRKIAPNTGANATKFFALATKSLKLVANLATSIFNHTLIPRDLAIVEDLLR